MVDESWLWHKRTGHLKFDNIVKVSKKEAIRDLSKIVKPLNSLCRHCQHGKQTKANFKTKEHMTSHPLEIVHTDLVDQQGLKVSKENTTLCCSLMTTQS